MSAETNEKTETARARIVAAFEADGRLGRLRERFSGRGAHLVGGAVRDVLAGVEPHELDVAIEGDAIALALELDPGATTHERFGPASIDLEGGRVDLAMTRTETYANGGALPYVSAASIDEDLRRRDFSVNAIAFSLDDATLRDPHDGIADLEAGVLRLLHPRSLHDDPTRALRGARYSIRLGLEPDPATLAQLQTTPLGEVSAARIEAELRRAAVESDPVAALQRLHSWGRAELHGDAQVARKALSLLGEPRWSELDRGDVVLAATVIACGKFEASGEELERAKELADAEVGSPAAALATAHGAGEISLLLARALGSEWIDDYVDEWRRAKLEIDGEDLIAAGVEPGQAIGLGLAAAVEAKLEGSARDRASQLEVALAAARG
ncbi:hypothetical protein BH10ACT11_BH10ACT11_11740 [soil metagenome]